MSLKVGVATDQLARQQDAADLRRSMREGMQIGGEPGIGGVGAPDASHRVKPGGPAEVGGFSGILEKTVEQANTKSLEADAKVKALADGTSDDLHGTMITMKEADISMKLVGTVRDKFMDAFHELWRINV